MSAANSSYHAFRRWARATLAHVAGVHGGGSDVAREVYQTSTMGALLDGVYDGDVTIGELLEHGDFGLGTFNRLDGEMLILDGVCHHLRADGSARIAELTDRTPFAAVTWFTPETRIPVPPGSDRAAVKALIDGALASVNLVYAVRLAGTFREIRTRTVMEQRPPYPPLTEATKGQQETVLDGVDGTLAGYRTPDYEQGISVAGYHLHFIDGDHRRGGHALDFRVERGSVEISARSELHVSLPRTPQFLASNLTPANIAGQIRQAEGG
ncbi:acetolactate decarboxylase [Dactylosporangium darangshiense]|uniref:Alpha-acetolactate decarboxylase n=1 Tax=Dactylosporangium darangshiense TaxID=579108 RepID=A0ABP8D9E1_9ACTN